MTDILAREGYVGWQQRFIVTGSCVLLFLSMTFPTVPKLMVLKSCLLASLLAAVLLNYWTGAGKRSRLDLRIALWTCGLITIGFLFMVKGMLAGNPGAAASVTVHILWPVTFALWIGGFTEERIFSAVHRTIIVATLFIGVYGCLYLLTELEVLPDVGLVSAFALGWDQGFGVQDGYTRMAIAGMNSLPFLVPYVMASAVIQPSWTGHRFRWTIFLWAACAASWFTVLAAGRRALFLVVLLTPVLIVLAILFRPTAERAAGR